MAIVSFPMQSGVFAGMTKEQLEAARSSAQQALLDLLSGNKAVELTYAQGDGSKSVKYTQASMANLRYLIGQLNAALTGMPSRRAIGLVYR